MTQKPSIGRIVHFVLANGEHRAATVTNVAEDGQCRLTVHLDVHRDIVLPGNGAAWAGPALRPQVRDGEIQGIYLGGDTLHVQAQQDEDTKAPGTWHFPERVE